MRSFSDARPFLPIDLPLVRRLAPRGVSFDSSTCLTRGVNTLEGAVWSAVPLADLGTPTFVLREGDNANVAQFRHKHGEHHAHITFIAPDVEVAGENAWLSLLDAMTRTAGKRGAMTLNAEVSEAGLAFATLRQAGFAVYARQEIWKREPAPVQPAPDMLRPLADEDAWAINSLYVSIVPKLVLQADTLPDAGHGGLVYERDGHLLAYVSVQEGKNGYYIQSLFHPDTYADAQGILASVLTRLPRADRLPVYVQVRRYQEWLHTPLADLGLYSWSSQAVMVKHTVARIEHPAFKTSHMLEGVMPVRTRVIDCMNCNVKFGRDHNSPVKEWFVNGISHHRRSGKVKNSPPRLSGRLA
jgi:hypothetical protein